MGNEKPPAFSFLDAATECDCERETTGADQKICRVTGNLSKIQSPGALRLRTRRSASPRAVDGGDGQQPAGGVGSAEFSSAGGAYDPLALTRPIHTTANPAAAVFERAGLPSR